MTIDRTTIIRERCSVTYDGVTIFPKGEVVITPMTKKASLSDATHGTVDPSIVTAREFRITLRPSGQFSDEAVAMLLAPLGLAINASLIGDTDMPLAINTLSGTKYTFLNAAITKVPSLTGKAGETVWGAMEWMAVIANDSDPSTAASYYTIGANAFPGESDFDPDAHPTLALTAAWGDTAPWDSFLAEQGWTLTPSIVATPIPGGDGIGICDYRLADAACIAQATPMGVTSAQALAAMPASGSLGARRTGQDLVLTATGLFISMKNAVIDEGDLGMGDRNLVGPCTWTARRKWVTGVMQPLLVVAEADPDA